MIRRRHGLSPRARGNLHLRLAAPDMQGPIPAGAGEPPARTSDGAGFTAYPRGRGGTRSRPDRSNPARGLSPRARGNPGEVDGDERPMRPIPAGAGEPTTRCCHAARRWAYPRGRGGTAGERLPFVGLKGLSPRARGNRRHDLHPAPHFRPIPAGAGEPRSPRRWFGRPGAYPRGRGGTECDAVLRPPGRGLSPRARGNPGPTHGQYNQMGPIPAGAGEPNSGFLKLFQLRAYPRGRGGTSRCQAHKIIILMSQQF